MKILHLNSSFASVPVLAEEQRNFGHVADIATYQNRFYDVGYDFLLEGNNIIDRALKFSSLASNYDVLHFHYHSALPSTLNYIDLPAFRILKKKIVMHYRGDDLREHPHIIPHFCASTIIVSTPDLLRYEPRAVWIPNPIRIEDYEFTDHFSHNPVVIAHAPTDRQRKGTHWVIDAVAQLQHEGYQVKLDLVEGISHTEALKRYARADIVAEQFVVGWHGDVATECMAMGKPVLCYILPELTSYIGDALVPTEPSELASHLKALVSSVEARKLQGMRGRLYVREKHNSRKIAHDIIRLYQGERL